MDLDIEGIFPIIVVLLIGGIATIINIFMLLAAFGSGGGIASLFMLVALGLIDFTFFMLMSVFLGRE